MQEFWSDWKHEVIARRALILWALLALILGLIGPFGAFQRMPMLARLGFWGGMMAVAVPLAFAFRVWLMARLSHRSYALRSVAVALAFSLAYTPLAGLALDELARRDLGTPVPLLLVFCATAVGSLAVCAARVVWGLDQPRERAVAAALPGAPPGQRAEPRLLQRLPPTLRGELVSITVRDHYVDVRTSAGSSSLLMRLADAVAETEGADGAQVHRSHWVAWPAVLGAERQAGKLCLRLRDGTRIPVSRRHHGLLAARGISVSRRAASEWRAPVARSAPQSPPPT